MPRSKPDLFLTVPTAIDPQTYTRSDLITPPCYVVSAPPPLVTPRPLLSRQSSSSTATSGSSTSEGDFDFDSEDSPLRIDTSPWAANQESLIHPAQFDENSMPLSPFEFTKPSLSLPTKPSQSALQNNNCRSHRSVAATRRRLLKLARESQKEDRMDIDCTGASSAMLTYHLFHNGANTSVARARSHPYARFDQPSSPFFRDLQFQHLPLASPFHEKRFELPLSPIPNPSEEAVI